MIERFGVADVAECFGSTDAGVVTMTRPGEPPRAGSAGRAIPGVDIRILDDEENELPVGAVGEIAVRAPAPRAEYYRDPEQTRAAYRGDWFLSGDLGRLDQGNASGRRSTSSSTAMPRRFSTASRRMARASVGRKW